MARPKKMADGEALNLRLARDAIDRAEALIPHVSTAQGIKATRADVLRGALMLGLRQLELERADASARRRRTG